MPLNFETNTVHCSGVFSYKFATFITRRLSVLWQNSAASITDFGRACHNIEYITVDVNLCYC